MFEVHLTPEQIAQYQQELFEASLTIPDSPMSPSPSKAVRRTPLTPGIKNVTQMKRVVPRSKVQKKVKFAPSPPHAQIPVSMRYKKVRFASPLSDASPMKCLETALHTPRTPVPAPANAPTVTAAPGIIPLLSPVGAIVSTARHPDGKPVWNSHPPPRSFGLKYSTTDKRPLATAAVPAVIPAKEKTTTKRIPKKILKATLGENDLFHLANRAAATSAASAINGATALWQTSERSAFDNEALVAKQAEEDASKAAAQEAADQELGNMLVDMFQEEAAADEARNFNFDSAGTCTLLMPFASQKNIDAAARSAYLRAKEHPVWSAQEVAREAAEKAAKQAAMHNAAFINTTVTETVPETPSSPQDVEMMEVDDDLMNYSEEFPEGCAPSWGCTIIPQAQAQVFEISSPIADTVAPFAVPSMAPFMAPSSAAEADVNVLVTQDDLEEEELVFFTPMKESMEDPRLELHNNLMNAARQSRSELSPAKKDTTNTSSLPATTTRAFGLFDDKENSAAPMTASSPSLNDEDMAPVGGCFIPFQRAFVSRSAIGPRHNNSTTNTRINNNQKQQQQVLQQSYKATSACKSSMTKVLSPSKSKGVNNKGVQAGKVAKGGRARSNNNIQASLGASFAAVAAAANGVATKAMPKKKMAQATLKKMFSWVANLRR